VYQHEIDEKAKKLRLWVRRKRGNKKIVCSGCGRRCDGLHEVVQREVRDLPCFEFRATVVVELYRVRCPGCGPRIEQVQQLPSKAPFSKRFEDAVGQACESASARLTSIGGVGEVTALTWALEIAEPHRFSSIGQARSYCGLTTALKSSAGKEQRGPISKQRNRHLQATA